ncbi:hypothetical protein PVL29_010756 [Vitis rotundifolia]|uniref:Uncharacterized protein n=1 Tax=Vitis rotundifolia TaxID=103349 RepID=A0AA39DS90_VITRO|nr:hypothetical protein PVL29_010756 [Vitis rotundifolia]
MIHVASTTLDKQLIEDLLAKVEESDQSQNGWLTIPKVPVTLRNIQDFPKWIEPSVISIGPYYHGHDNLQEGEKLKPLWAKRFIDDSNQRVRCLYQKIERKIRELRNCYDNQAISEYNDKQLATMFVLDGCFLLHFIRSFCSNKEGGLNGSNFTNHHIAYIQQDLFLLENQLPFQVLKLLFQDAQFQDSNSIEELIKDFVTSKIIMSRGKSGIKLKDEENVPFHLLDLLRGVLLGKLKNISKQLVVVSEPQQQMQEVDEKGNPQETNKKHIQLSPTLMATGIQFRRSKTGELRDVSFTSYGMIGYLNLPLLAIDRSSVPRLWNLIAYEMCPNMTSDSGVTSYVSFLDSLHDNSEDVKELEFTRVLQNFFGGNEEVAQFFNSISVNWAVRDFSAYYYVPSDTRAHVRRHNSNRTPWTIIALVAAILVLFLTDVQTYFTVFPRSTW